MKTIPHGVDSTATAIVIILCILALLLIVFQIIGIRRLRQSRRQMEAERRRIDEAKLHFFSSISYDLRTPLSMIISPLDRIIAENAGRPVAGQLKQVAGNARLLMDEIDRLLDFKHLKAEASGFNPTYGDFAAFAEEVCLSYSAISGDTGDSVSIDPAQMPVMTDFDRDRMQRILHNLIGNALRRRVSEKPVQVLVSVRQEGDRAVLRVSDNGKGISDSAKAHLFEPYYDEEKKGLPWDGISLCLIREYASQHGGDVTVADNHPSGSVFTVSFPISLSLKPDGAAEDGAKRQKRPGRPLILNVEDNHAFRYFVTENLSDRYDVAEASSSAEALRIIEDNDFDLILIDQLMPGMDGRELCRALRADIRHADTPIILLTTVHGEEAALENLRAGADDTIEKPFNIESLIIRIQRLLKRKAPLLKYTDESGHRISRQDREFLDKVIAEIEDNLQESEYTIENLCSTLGISRSGLYKKMMALTGKAPLEYIRLLRLEKGREMLENGETSVSQIAWSVGFSPKQFSKHFKDEYGCLPSEYIHSLLG